MGATMTTVLHVAYRPKTFEEVIGQGPVVKSLKKLIAEGRSQAFLLSGPSGTGKTTLARIAATALGCDHQDIMEIDAATHTGVDAMRSIQEILRYKPFGKSQVRAVIIDEAHGLSRQSWESLLKVIEEPPAHVVWFFCTTQIAKVPVTIKTRCSAFALKAVNESELLTLLDDVCKEEGIDIPDDVADAVVSEANGSPRQMLVNLALCSSCKSRKEASKLLQVAMETDATLELCRFLMRPGSWVKCVGILEKLDGENPEGVRIIVCNYLGSVIKNAKSDKAAIAAMEMLSEFSQPYNQAEGMAPLYLSIGRVIFR
jgi:DNA polymerase III gamma/tau subunit